MKIEQKAGVIEAVAFTDGWPINTRLGIHDVNFSLSTAELHDLRYVVDRMLAQIPEKY